jgi:hypothetical protein
MRRIKQFKTMFILIIAGAMTLIVPSQLFAGDLESPGPPGSTMKTMDQITPTWSLILPVFERFEDVMGGEAVLDNETSLVWAKNANLDGTKAWQSAINYCAYLEIADRKGWRLPTREELASLFDMSQSEAPYFPPGVFNNVQSSNYWSSTTYESDSNYAWFVGMVIGYVHYDTKIYGFYVWPVRGGND